MKKVICIVGPTASGKTSLALALAKQFKGQIINCDAVQVYQELNIGSAKITKKEQDDIVHHLLDVVKVGQDFSIYDYQLLVRPLITKINLPIMVGGSGLYLKSALYDYQLLPTSKINLPSMDEMTATLKENYPDLAIDYHNPRRVQSVYQKYKNQGFLNTNKRVSRPLYDILTIYLEVDKTTLKQRITARLDYMLDLGLIAECQALLDQGYDLNIIGYQQINRYLKNEITLEKAKELIITASMQYAKRQRTWFLNQMPVKLLDATKDNLFAEAVKLIEGFLHE